MLIPSTRMLTHLAPVVAAAGAAAEQYARYNVSMDASYHVMDTSLSSYQVLKILHAAFASNLDPVIYRTRLTKDELEHFHRPALAFPRGEESLTIRPVDPAVSLAAEDRDTRYVPSNLEELSATDSDILLVEYLERYPPLLMNAGMCSQVITYYRKRDDKDVHQPEVSDGDVVVLGRKDPSPFLGEVKEGATVTALTNNLFIAPAAKHQAPPNTFLLIRSESSWFIRPLPSCYVVGQQEPKQSVPYPNRTHAQELLRKQIEVFIYKRFRDESSKRRFNMAELDAQFGSSVTNDVLARRVLKDVATFHRATEDWMLDSLDKLPSEEKLQLTCTPEDVCVYEAMLAADHRLKDELGIKQFTNAKQIADLIDALTAPDVRRVSEYILKHVLLMPWTLTRGFLAAKDGKGTLALVGRGNPFAEGCGYSFINEKVTAKKKESEYPELAEPKKKTGTSADLRKLTMEQMAASLVKLGMGEEEVAGLLRWDRVRAIARLSTEAVLEGRYLSLQRFARQARPTNAGVLEEQKKQIAAIFERQLAMLAKPGNPDYSHEVDDDPGAVKDKVGPARPKPKPKGRSDFLSQRKKEREEEEEYKEFLAQRERDLKDTQGGAAPKAKAASASPARVDAPTLAEAVGVGGGAGKRKKKVLITKLSHVIKVTNKDGTQTVETRTYDDKDLIRCFLLDIRDQSRDKGKHLRQRLQLDSMQVGGEKKTAAGKDEEDDEEEKHPKGEAKVEVILPPPGRVKIRTLDGIRAHMARRRGGVDPSLAGQKKRRTKRGEIDDMFDLNDDDLRGGAGAFTFGSPSADTSSPILTSTSSNTFKLSRRILQATPQDVYTRPNRKRKAEDPHIPLAPKKLVSRRRGDPARELNALLGDVINEIFPLPYAAPFRQPVSEKEAPDYEDEIQHPMDLGTMRSNCSKNLYKNREDFLEDVTLIVRNCETFNGANDAIGLSHQARTLADDAFTLINDVYRDRLDEAEAYIAHHRLMEELNDAVIKLQTLPGWKVFAVTPAWPEYLARVPTPIGLDVLRQRVDRREYETVGEFLFDVKQIWDNSVLYNGAAHDVTIRAHQMFIEANDVLTRRYSAEDRTPSDALIQRKAKAPDATPGPGPTPGHGPSPSPSPPAIHTPAQTPSMRYQPSSRATPSLATPSQGSLINSPSRSPGLSPRAASPKPGGSSSPLPPLSRAQGDTSRVAVGQGLMTPFMGAPSAAGSSPLFTQASASPQLGRVGQRPEVISTSAYLPTGVEEGAGADEHDRMLSALFGGEEEGGGMEGMGLKFDSSGELVDVPGMDVTGGEEKKDMDVDLGVDDQWA